MYLHTRRKPRSRNRNKTNRLRAKQKAKFRRRINRVAGRRLSARRSV